MVAFGFGKVNEEKLIVTRKMKRLVKYLNVIINTQDTDAI